MADRGVARADLAARARAARVRAPDAARRARGAARRAGRGGTQTARLRPVRRALVRLLAAAAAGEPGDGGDDREGDGRPGSAAEPMIWARAEGCRVTLTDGRELLDLTGGFGVAALGHRNPRILEAWREQEVGHALGDPADAEVTVRLREALPRPAKLGVTGEDAVEIGRASCRERV